MTLRGKKTFLRFTACFVCIYTPRNQARSLQVEETAPLRGSLCSGRVGGRKRGLAVVEPLHAQCFQLYNTPFLPRRQRASSGCCAPLPSSHGFKSEGRNTPVFRYTLFTSQTRLLA